MWRHPRFRLNSGSPSAACTRTHVRTYRHTGTPEIQYTLSSCRATADAPRRSSGNSREFPNVPNSRLAGGSGASTVRRRAVLQLQRHAATSSGGSSVTARERELEQELRMVKWKLGSMATQIERLERALQDRSAPPEMVAAKHTDDAPLNVEQMTSTQLLKKRNKKYFTESLRRVVEVLSLEEGAVPVGSFKYLAFLYPGDIDLFEGLFFPFTNRGTAAVRAAGRIQTMARRIQLEETRGTMFFADFKAGYDDRLFLISDSELAAGSNAFDSIEFQRRLSDAIQRGMLTHARAAPARTLSARMAAWPDTDAASREHDWIELVEEVRKLYTLRWSLQELVAGVKTLPSDGGKTHVKIHLSDALQAGSVVKIDIWGLLQDELGYTKYSEVTNFFQLQYRDAETSQIRSMTKEFTTSYLASIEADLVHYSMMPQHCNPMKVAKRLWLKATALHDDDTLRTLYPLFSSPACALAQVCAESEVIRAMCRSLPPEQVLANIERILNQTLAFSKRVKSQLASAGSNRASAMRPTITRHSTLRKEYLYQSGFRQQVDACLDPIFDEIWAEIQRENLLSATLCDHPLLLERFCMLSERLCDHLEQLEALLDGVVHEYTLKYLLRHDLWQGHVPAADAWLHPPLYVQNLDELVQLDHIGRDLPRMVPPGDTISTAPYASTCAPATETPQDDSASAREDEQSTRYVYRPPKNAAGRYNHYDAVAR